MKFWLLGLLILLSSCTQGFQSSGAASGGPAISLTHAALNLTQLVLSGTGLDTVHSISVSQAGVAIPLSFVSQSAAAITLALNGNAAVKAAQPVNVTLNSDTGALSVNLTINLSGTTLTNFTSTGITDLATATEMTLSAAGGIGVGTGAPDSPLVISRNANNLQSANSGTLLHLGNADGVRSRVLVDGYGTEEDFSFRAALGTAALPTLLTLNTSLGSLKWFGYGASTYSTGARTTITSFAGEAWSDTAQGTYLSFSTTPLTTVATAERMRLDANGNLGLGTVAAAANRLSVLGPAASTVALFSDGAQTCAITPSTSGNISCSSDARLKKDVTALDDAQSLRSILQLNGVTYRWRKGDDVVHTGFIAQEVEKVVPEFVRSGEDGFKQVSYMAFTPLITGSVRELTRRIEEQRQEIGALARKNLELEARLKTLESR